MSSTRRAECDLAASVIGNVAAELIPACLRGQKIEMDSHITKNQDGTYNDGREIRIRIEPSGPVANSTE